MTAPPLRMLFWESTARCNLRCAHCRRLDVDAAPDELTTAEAMEVFDSAARLGSPVVVFSGGEPLLRDDWEPLARHAVSLGLPTALATNGSINKVNALITDDKLNDQTRLNFEKIGAKVIVVKA